MKGTKGMQKRIFLFLMFTLGISNNALSLNLRKPEVSFFETSDVSPNVATISDIIREKPNEAFLPDEGDAIKYDIALADGENEKASNLDDEYFDDENVEPVVASIPEIKKVAGTKEVAKAHEKKSRTLANILKPKTSPIKRAVKDKFSNVVVGEGEEVLVSSTALIPGENKTPKVPSVSQTKPIPEKNVAVAPVAPIPPVVETNTASSDENPFGVIVSKTKKKAKKYDVSLGNANPFVRAFSALKPERTTAKPIVNNERKREKTISYVSSDSLKRDLQNTYLSDNQYLSPVESIDEDELEEDVDETFEDEAEEDAEEFADDENFQSQKNVKQALEGKGDVDINEIKEKIQKNKKSKAAPSGPLKAGVREVLQMKIDFQDGSSAVSSESVNLIRSFAQIVSDQPTNSIEITIPESVMKSIPKKKLTARRLSIVSNILREAGISDKQIKPVLSNRDEDSFAFRVVTNDDYTKLRVSKGTDIFGEEENVKEYDIMKW